MKVAAVQMLARLADVDYNLKRAEELLDEAFGRGCEMVILPEFFTSAVAFHPDMLEAAVPFNGPVLEMMRGAARRHRGYVGGSFIASRGGENYNTFVLAFPDGDYATHDKDQPTMWENCYYRGGKDDGILETPMGPVGVALCWEFVRSRTVRRLRGKVDLLVGGSCWWTVPDKAIPIPGKKHAHERNLEIMRETPVRMARMLGVPVVHAAHAQDFACRMPLLPGLPYRSYYLGETMIVDAAGEVLARLSREEGEGIAVADVQPGRVTPCEDPPDGFWIPELPWLIRMVWGYQNPHGRWYYRRTHTGLTPY
ncbi:MAG: carbon-nitrogen hydrolase family protein [Actinobacteria bacterium]|jgi:predicted amidohydrolase|nr:MAG: carbon-nitrogen hydrolase family protein [Actinomycetota bacterium]